MDCVLSLLVSWHCTIVINDNYWRLPPLLLCSLLIPLTLEMISIRLSVAIENRMENDFLDLKLKVRGKGLFDLFLARKTKNDLIELIKQSDEPARSSLVEIAKKKQIKNNVIFTKNELEQALGLSSKKDKMTKPYVFSNAGSRFEFATRKEAMNGMNLCAVGIANAAKNGKIVIGDVEYDFKRE